MTPGLEIAFRTSNLDTLRAERVEICRAHLARIEKRIAGLSPAFEGCFETSLIAAKHGLEEALNGETVRPSTYQAQETHAWALKMARR